MLKTCNSITLEDLPSPPPGKTGWPWTEASKPLSSTMPNGEPWSKISIVTPSYNQGEFIEETIRSVLLQGYPNLEYIVIDGGSTDQTQEVLEIYKPFLSYMVSEPDNGQSDAINKGFVHASGFVRGYLNSDDVFLPDAINNVAVIAAEYPQKSILITGNALMCGESISDIVKTWHSTIPKSFASILQDDGFFPQPATFWSQPTSEKHLFNSSLVFCMDREFWIRLLNCGYQPIKLDLPLAFYRHHEYAKSTQLTGFMWSERAGIALSNIENLKSIDDKISVAHRSQTQTRHYFRIVVRQILETEGKIAAIRALLKICLANPTMVIDRPTLGLLRQLIFNSFTLA